MKAFFSKRHQEALRSKKLRPSFSASCRVAIKRILEEHSEHSESAFSDYNNDTFVLVEHELKTFWGLNHLLAFDSDNKRVPATLSEVIENGYPSELLDIIESWFNQQPRDALTYEKELNDVFQLNDLPWRVVNGLVILTDSEYLYREVQAKSVQLLKDSEIHGALEEFQEATNDLTSGKTKDAVVNAHKSVESVMKAVLNTNENLTFGALLDKLIKSNIIPSYYDEFLKHFEKLALGVVKERNLPARGHGQGKDTTIVSQSLAEFAVNLAGAINVFIVKHWIETRQLTPQNENILKDDLPF